MFYNGFFVVELLVINEPSKKGKLQRAAGTINFLLEKPIFILTDRFVTFSILFLCTSFLTTNLIFCKNRLAQIFFVQAEGYINTPFFQRNISCQ